MAKERILRPAIAEVKDMINEAMRIESVVSEESLKPSETAWISKLVEEEKKRLSESA